MGVHAGQGGGASPTHAPADGKDASVKRRTSSKSKVRGKEGKSRAKREEKAPLIKQIREIRRRSIDEILEAVRTWDEKRREKKSEYDRKRRHRPFTKAERVRRDEIWRELEDEEQENFDYREFVLGYEKRVA